MMAIVDDSESIIEETSHVHPSSSRSRWRRNDAQLLLNRRLSRVHSRLSEVHTLILLDASLEPTGACWGLGGICWFCRWGKSDISNSKFSGGKAEAALGGGDWSELLVGVGDGTGAVAILVVLGWGFELGFLKCELFY